MFHLESRPNAEMTLEQLAVYARTHLVPGDVKFHWFLGEWYTFAKARAKVEHGNIGEWQESNFPQWSQSTINRAERLYASFPKLDAQPLEVIAAKYKEFCGKKKNPPKAPPMDKAATDGKSESAIMNQRNTTAEKSDETKPDVAGGASPINVVADPLLEGTEALSEAISILLDMPAAKQAERLGTVDCTVLIRKLDTLNLLVNRLKMQLRGAGVRATRRKRFKKSKAA